jgi:hypothetical protein
MLFARKIKERFGVPVLLDFQDPWVSAWGKRQPKFSKSGLVHRLAALLEPRALRSADFVTAVSNIQNHEMHARYPWFDATRMAAIPIGGDPQDFNALRGVTWPTEFAANVPPGQVQLSYVGTFLPRSGPLVRILFRAYRRLQDREPLLAKKVRLNFIGTSNQPNDFSTYRVRPIAEAEGVADGVREIPNRIPYLASLNILSNSSGILLIGSDEPHYTASKIYPALMSGRPFISLFHRASSSHAILSAAGGGRAFAFDNQNELEALETSLMQALQDLAFSPELLGTVSPQAYAPFEARTIAASFARILDSLAAPR